MLILSCAGEKGNDAGEGYAGQAGDASRNTGLEARQPESEGLEIGNRKFERGKQRKNGSDIAWGQAAGKD